MGWPLPAIKEIKLWPVGGETSWLSETIEHLRGDIDKIDEPQLKAMFETAAEVLTGLKKAFSDYERKNESAWHN